MTGSKGEKNERIRIGFVFSVFGSLVGERCLQDKRSMLIEEA